MKNVTPLNVVLAVLLLGIGFTVSVKVMQVFGYLIAWIGLVIVLIVSAFVVVTLVRILFFKDKEAASNDFKKVIQTFHGMFSTLEPHKDEDAGC